VSLLTENPCDHVVETFDAVNHQLIQELS
jgi:hypothetical protein